MDFNYIATQAMRIPLYVIEWCNANAGFVNAIGAIATAAVAILLAYLPHRASMEFNYFLDASPLDACSGGSYTCPLHLYLCNAGNTALTVSEIIVTNGKGAECGHYHRGFGEFVAPKQVQEYVFEVRVPEARFAKQMRVLVKTDKKTFCFRTAWAVG